MKGKKFPARLDYLKGLRDSDDLEESWRSVWQTNHINTQNEREFFLVFSQVIDDLLEKK